jgi:hypothetical protein
VAVELVEEDDPPQAVRTIGPRPQIATKNQSLTVRRRACGGRNTRFLLS